MSFKFQIQRGKLKTSNSSEKITQKCTKMHQNSKVFNFLSFFKKPSFSKKIRFFEKDFHETRTSWEIWKKMRKDLDKFRRGFLLYREVGNSQDKKPGCPANDSSVAVKRNQIFLWSLQNSQTPVSQNDKFNSKDKKFHFPMLFRRKKP